MAIAWEIQGKTYEKVPGVGHSSLCLTLGKCKTAGAGDNTRDIYGGRSSHPTDLREENTKDFA